MSVREFLTYANLAEKDWAGYCGFVVSFKETESIRMKLGAG